MANEAKTAKKWVWNPLHDYVVDYRIPQSPPPVIIQFKKIVSKIPVSELPQKVPTYFCTVSSIPRYWV